MGVNKAVLAPAITDRGRCFQERRKPIPGGSGFGILPHTLLETATPISYG